MVEMKYSHGRNPEVNYLMNCDNMEGLQFLVEKNVKIDLCYIDPPYNTGVDREDYVDTFDEASWLSFMRDRLTAVRVLLSDKATVWVHLNDKMVFQTKMLMDEVYGKDNYIAMVVVTPRTPSGFGSTGTMPTVTEYILVYAKRKEQVKINIMYRETCYNNDYQYFLLNPEEPIEMWKYTTVKQEVARRMGFSAARDANKVLKDFDEKVATFAIENHERVFALKYIKPSGGAFKKRVKVLERSKSDSVAFFNEPDADGNDFIIHKGRQVVFYTKRFREIGGRFVPTTVVTNVWDDISWAGISSEGGVTMRDAKKPERLIKRIMEMGTQEGDRVLDCFLGCGTTAAVAHKMRRNWVGIEKGEHFSSKVLPRLKRVIADDSLFVGLGNRDRTGITDEVGWTGGGGFTVYA